MQDEVFSTLEQTALKAANEKPWEEETERFLAFTKMI